MRADEFLVNAVINNINYGVWDKCTGGGVTASDTKYRPGGAGTEVSLGGPATVENVTISRLFVRERDIAIARTLQSLVGKCRARVSKQALDASGVAYGSPFVYSGTLTKVTIPEADSTSNSASMFEIEISCDGVVA